jgi:predicted anti-sigma-YlaC factor YlaD
VTCSECRESLSALLDGEDQRGERERVERHLGGCAACRAYADAAARLTRLARTEPVAAQSDIVPAVDALLTAAEPSAPGRAPGRRRTLRLTLAALRVGQPWVAARAGLAALGIGQLWVAARAVLARHRPCARGARGGRRPCGT